MTKHPSRNVMNFRHLLSCDTIGAGENYNKTGTFFMLQQGKEIFPELQRGKEIFPVYLAGQGLFPQRTRSLNSAV